MKRYILCVSIQLIVTFMASAQNADAILGIWHSPHGNTDIQIIKKDDKYFGVTVMLKEVHNGHTQSKSDTGTVILKDFRYRDRGVYYGGRVIDQRSGRSNNGQMRLINNDRLDIRIFFGIIQFGRTETWTRVVQ